MALHLLADADVAILQELIAEHRRKKIPTGLPLTPPHVFQAPECYIAKTPSGGIAALSGTTPGSATCDIYKINTGSTLEAVSSFDKTVYNLSETAVDGSTWVVVHRTKYGKWIAYAPNPATMRRFELTENLVLGSNATAYWLKWTGAAYVAQADVSFEVYDPFSKFAQGCKPTGQDGARGYARYFPDRGIWEIVQMEHQARWIEFYLAEAMATTDISANCDNVAYLDGYEPDTAVTTVYNKSASTNYIFEGDDNDRGIALAAWSVPLSAYAYRIIQMECP